MKLHLGCGNRRLEAFVNIDNRKTEATDVVADVRELSYERGSVDEIFFAHGPQLLSHDENRDLLLRFNQWLDENKGRATVILPDFDRIVVRYIYTAPISYTIFVLRRFILGQKAVTPFPLSEMYSKDIIGSDIVGYGGPHRSLYNSASFIELAGSCGFEARLCEVDRSKYSHHWTTMAFHLRKVEAVDSSMEAGAKEHRSLVMGDELKTM
jgi:hypothetical protein